MGHEEGRWRARKEGHSRSPLWAAGSGRVPTGELLWGLGPDWS